MTENAHTGIVFGIQRLSIHDGPGIRTTVFLKGCNVNCKWCHNPEGIPMQPLIGLNQERCVRCGACAAACPNGCHSIENGEHHFDRRACEACGKCVDACPVQALDLIGKRMTADEVMKVVLKDQKYYGEDGGVNTNKRNTFDFDFYFDNEAPVIRNATYEKIYDKTLKKDRYYINLTVYDNQYAMSITPILFTSSSSCP